MARGDAHVPVATSRRDEIGGVADSVNELALSLQRLEELRRQVTNDVAHELRTPLHNLLGLIEGMRDGVIPATPARLQQAHNELGRLIALVEDLRGLADAQLARDRMAREPLQLEKVVREVVLGFDTSLQTHRLTCQILSPQGELTVDGDAGRLGQVLANIIDNAIRSAAAGSVITISLTRRDSLVRVAVHDVGETIAADSLPHIFERFYRVDPSRARGSGGAGIGLAIVKELVAAHGGIVGAESESDSVTVWFELPLQALEPDRSPPRDPVQTIRSLDAASSA
jgi:signal transduction histidine kinase